MNRIFRITIILLAIALIAVISVQIDAAQKKSIVVSFKNDIATLDPAIGYDWQNWPIINLLFDGLMGYNLGTTKLVPNLAESYTVSPNGKTYTFKLRKHIKFHNGRELVASDVKYSIERVLNSKTQSPGAGFFLDIAGAEDYSHGKVLAVSGLKVLNNYTVQINLAKPNAAFLNILALNFAFVVPKEEVQKYGKDFGRHPIGTGTFLFKEWTMGQRLVLEKNPNYHMPNMPLLDEIVYQMGLDPSVALQKLQKGEVDLLGDGIPSSGFTQVMGDQKLNKLVVVKDQLQTSYVAINTQIKPFDNLKVRQALNMAINKERITQIINGKAIPANQILPPLMPGYNSGYKGYPYDPKQARQLLAEAGLSNGFSTMLYANNGDPNPQIAKALQQDLAVIGVKAELKILTQNTVIEAGGTQGTAPLIWSGGMAWVDDYPDPGDFFWPILSTSSATSGGWNWSWYSNPAIDKRAEIADAIVAPDKQPERIKLWRGIMTDVMNDAPWIPIFHEKRYTMHSERLTASSDAIFVDLIYIINYKGLYLK